MFPTSEIENKVLEFSETEDKAGLDEYAKQFDVKLDRRKSFDNMVESFAKELGERPKGSFDSDNPEEPVTDSQEEGQEDGSVPEGNDEEVVDQEVSTHSVPENDEKTQSEDGSESVGDMDSSDEPESKPEEPVGEFKADFRPSFNLTFTDSRYGGEYANVGYWVIDDLQKNRVVERGWSLEAINECRHQKDVLTILFYIEKNGSCLVRESRNSRFYRISKTGVKVAG